MADFSNQDFGNIGLSFANWKRMANIDKSPFGEQGSSQGVAPPKDIGQQMKDAKDQFSSFFNSAKQAFGVAPPGQSSTTSTNQPSDALENTSPTDNSFDYTSGLDISGLGDIGGLEGGMSGMGDMGAAAAAAA